MDWMLLISTILPQLAGPASAIIICVGVIVFVGYLVTKHLIPSVEKRFTDSQSNIESLMEEHKADREVFKEAISTLTIGQATISQKMDKLSDNVDFLSDRIEDFNDKVKSLDNDISRINKHNPSST